jgi:hypothetical protein
MEHSADGFDNVRPLSPFVAEVLRLEEEVRAMTNRLDRIEVELQQVINSVDFEPCSTGPNAA